MRLPRSTQPLYGDFWGQDEQGDTEGLPMTVRVTSAQPHDSTLAPLVLRGIKEKFPRLQKVFGNSGYSGPLQNWFMVET